MVVSPLVGSPHLTWLVLLAALSVVSVTVTALGAPLTHRTVLAAAPWMATAGLVARLAATGMYEQYAVLFTFPTVVLVVAVLAGGIWAVGLLLATVRDRTPSERYLAAGGVGTLLVVSLGIVDTIAPTIEGTIWFLIAPISAGLLAAVGYFLVGLVYTSALARLRFAGLFVVFAVTLDGVTTAVSSAVFARPESAVLSGWLRQSIVTNGVDPTAWLYVGTGLAVGVVVVVLCGRLGARSLELANGAALVVSTVLFAPATYTLVFVTLG